MAEPLSIGRYSIIKELGQGGMATVFLARDPGVDRVVAVKVLPEQLARESQLRARFRREARIIAALEHAYIVPIYEYGEDAGQGPYLVMRYFPGGTLADLMKQRPMPLAEVVRVTVRLATALDYAHRRGVIHRDLKPKNVLLDDEAEVMLSDFGVAKLLQETTELTAAGALIGTPPYMSPEQLRGAELTAQSDIYSLGIMVYEMLTGQVPYQSDSIYGLIRQHNDAPVPELNTAQYHLPAACNLAVKRALAKKPDERYATAGEFARALNGLLTQPLAMPVSRTGPQASVSTSAPTFPVDVPTAEVDYVPTPTPASPLDAPTATRSSASAQILTAKIPLRRPYWMWMAGGAVTLIALALGVSMARNFVVGQSSPTPTLTLTTTLTLTAPLPTRTPPPVASVTRTPPPVQPTKTAPPPVTATNTSTATHTLTRTPPPVQPTRTSPPISTATPVPPSATSIPPTNPPLPTDTQPPPTNTTIPPTSTVPPPPATPTPP